MSGIADVARLAGVSKSTASRALTGSGYASEETRRRVAEAAATLAYVPSTNAVGLATGRTQNIGVIMPYATRWFFAEVLEGIHDALLERGLDLTLYDARPATSRRSHMIEQFLARQRFDGLIAVALEPDGHELARLLAIKRPVVSVVGGDGSTSAIGIDDDNAARRATEHLLALGHRRIAFLGGGHDGLWAHVDRLRLRGYAESMSDAGLSAYAEHRTSPVDLPGAYAVAIDFLAESRGRPSAIVGVCDEVAIGAVLAARRLGIRVPTDLSVAGIDNHEYAEMFSLTTLEQNPREQGAAAVGLLMEHIRDPDRAPTLVNLHARMVMRGSTAPPFDVDSTQTR